MMDNEKEINKRGIKKIKIDCLRKKPPKMRNTKAK
jgi:hypothetical protein